jgi:hypothetical protein
MVGPEFFENGHIQVGRNREADLMTGMAAIAFCDVTSDPASDLNPWVFAHFSLDNSPKSIEITSPSF